MKRKIAILLSAMMVTSVMPLTANAAQLKSDSVLNTASAKVGETLDPNASKYGDPSFNTVNDLRSRQSVLKINLNNDSTDDIKSGSSFYVDLENGTFPEDKAKFDNMFKYININGQGQKVDEKALTGAKSLTDVWKMLANKNGSASNGDITTDVTALETAIKNKATTAQGTAGTLADLMKAIKGDTSVTEAFAKIKGATPELLHIPYTVNYVSPTRIEVKTTVPLTNEDKDIKAIGSVATIDDLDIKLFNGSTLLDEGNYNDNKASINRVEVTVKTNDLKDPYIALPLGGVEANGDGPVKAKVTADYTNKIVGGEYTITRGLEGGSTTLVYDDKNVKSFEDGTTLERVVIRENVRNTIGKDTNNDNKKDTAVITVRLSGGFRFSKDITTSDVVLDSPVITQNIKVDSVKMNDSMNQAVITISNLENVDRTNPIGIGINNIGVEASNDKTFGDVEISVSGDGIDSQSKLVAKREALSFKLETLKDATDIISGRHYEAAEDAMVKADNTTVEVRFSEAVPNTLIRDRALDFNVPEGVKIVDVEIDEYKNLRNISDQDFEITNDGRTLRLKRHGSSDEGRFSNYEVVDKVKSLAGFKMKFNLSIDPSFTGDVKLSVVGGGQAEGVTPDVVIAKAKAPFEVKTQTTKVDLGYQDYNTADISIVETKPGMFLAGKNAVISLEAPYGTSELGFSEAKFEVTGGELTVKEKDFKINNGRIEFKVDRSSYKNPSTMTIKNVKIGSTRAVPFGAYNLSIAGDAIINNYSKENKDVAFDKDVNLAKTLNKNDAASNGLRFQDNTDHYEVKSYVDVVTATGTFNETVKVSVGEKTILLGGKAIDMDVAPYIQAASNSTMVPLRFVSVALGVDTDNAANPDVSSKIVWDANSKTTTIYYGAGTGQKIIQFQAGSNIMTVDGTRIPMEYGVKAEIKDGRMFVPFRALGQALGVTVTWDADTRTAIYNENNARNVNATTTETTTAKDSTTESTTATKESSTESTTASKESSTETTTAKK